MKIRFSKDATRVNVTLDSMDAATLFGCASGHIGGQFREYARQLREAARAKSQECRGNAGKGKAAA